MKIFAISGTMPFAQHGERGVTAANLVADTFLTGLAARGHTVTVQCILHRSDEMPELTAAEKEQCVRLESLGMTVENPLYNHQITKPSSERFRSLKLLLSKAKRLAFFYPAICWQHEMRRRIEASDADVVVTFWTPEGVASVSGIHDIPRVAYQGDIDFDPSEAAALDRELYHGKGSKPNMLRSLDQRLRRYLYRKTHLELMSSIDSIANNTASNSDYYRAKGLSHSVYVGSTWPDSKPELPSDPHILEHEGPYKILGHVGYLDRTGSTYGLHFLQQVIPHLERALSGVEFEVHIIGGGTPAPTLSTLLEHPRVVRRGFVEDLDSEIQNCDLFCLFNNAGRYQSLYTRHIVAWSMGACLVVHGNSARVIPELASGGGALVASCPEEMATRMAEALQSPKLNLQTRHDGRALYEANFAPEIATKKFERALEDALSCRG